MWLLIDVVLIGGAVVQWYLYWRAYIEFRIQELQDTPP